jgi:RNA polymerase sigma factor (sigma-70 family)
VNAGREAEGSHADTTIHVRRARAGDLGSLEWIVTHFTPLLLSQARYRLGRHLQGLYDPEDLVQNAWMITIGRFKDLQFRNGRITPVLLSYLSSVILQDYRNLLAKHMGKPVPPAEGGADTIAAARLAEIPADTSTVATKAIRHERVRELRLAIDRLSEQDQEILILHGVEQLPFKLIGAKLGLNESTLRSRYHRALQELKATFPSQMIAEMEREA